MRHSTFNVSFYCRESKRDKEGFAPVELSIIINGERTYISLPRKERPEKFRAAVKSRKRNGIKDYLDTVRERLDSIMTDMMEREVLLSAFSLKEYFKYGGVRCYTIESLFNEYMNIIVKKVDTGEVTAKTYRKYELARDKFYTIISKDKPVELINSQVIAEYMATLKKEYNGVTASGYGQKIKTVVRYGMSKGTIKQNPFIGVHLKKEDAEVEYLTVEELDRIRDTDCQNESLNKVRDLFVFQAASGMSYCDMAALVPEDYQRTEDGHLYVHKKRAKTKVYFTSVILSDGEAILEKYDYRLPIISNNKYNAYLKFIKNLCEIEKPLHTHIARHSYATRCLNQGIRLEVVAKLLGHSTTRITQHYAKLLEGTIIDEVKEAWEKA